MKVFFHNDFYQVYTSDPAAEKGRMEAVVRVIEPFSEFVRAEPAFHDDVAAVHTQKHIEYVQDSRLYPISVLAAGATVQAAETGLAEPCFALVRPPGHHASADSSWGFCYFNNMAIAIESLKRRGRIETAYVLDIDLHYGDGTVNIFEDRDYVTVHNIEATKRDAYLLEVEREMERCDADIIGVSAGFDNHVEDWGGVLLTEDYFKTGSMVSDAARRAGSGCFAVLEGGYNHDVLGQNVLALMKGMAGCSWQPTTCK